MKLQFFV